MKNSVDQPVLGLWDVGVPDRRRIGLLGGQNGALRRPHYAVEGLPVLALEEDLGLAGLQIGDGHLGAERPELVRAVDVAAGVGRVRLVLRVHVPEVVRRAVELLGHDVLAEAAGQPEGVIDDRARLARGRAAELVERLEVGGGVPVLAVTFLGHRPDGRGRERHRHQKCGHRLETTCHPLPLLFSLVRVVRRAPAGRLGASTLQL